MDIERNKELMGINKVLYHSILKNKVGTFEELINSITQNGLVPHDNGELGPTIWFSTKPFGDTENHLLLFSIIGTEENIHKYDILIENSATSYAWASKQIPFDQLTIELFPAFKIKNQYFNNKRLVDYFENYRNNEEGMMRFFNKYPNKLHFIEPVVRKYLGADFVEFLRKLNPDCFLEDFKNINI